MGSRRIIIGAIGGDKQPDPFAAELGAAVTRAGCILLTGGEPSHASDVKNAAMRGAVEEEAKGQGVVARLIRFCLHAPRLSGRGFSRSSSRCIPGCRTTCAT